MSDQHSNASWRQVNLGSDSWRVAEQTAVTHLGPLLTDAEDAGQLTRWWFVRKGESWRLRFQPAAGHEDTTSTALGHLAADLMDQGVVRRYAEVIYEPETLAFGGHDAMALAHDLFHADSRHILGHLASSATGTDHRRELGLLLGTRLMRAAGLDFYEQGDVWAQLAAHRSTETDPEASPTTLTALQRFLTAAGDSADSPLTSAPNWPAAFEHTGQALAALAQDGELTRGLRAVLAHHLLFAFNRMGISAADQSTLAIAATRVIFQKQNSPDPTLTDAWGTARPTTVTAVTTDAAAAPAADPEQLREALIAHLDRFDAFRTSQVRQAFRTVPRHLFLPGADLPTAYAPKPVVTKRADDDTAVSSASSPHVVATMLEQLDVRPGHRVLEIGAATGINAALLAELVGPTGTVVTIELDDDLAAGARTHLTEAGYDQVEVVCGDGALGHPAAAPYDRIIVTAGAWDIVAAWWQQLSVGGRLVVPLRLHGSGLTRSLAFDLVEHGRMVSTSATVCGFVPMRGAAEMGERHIRLADDVILKVDAGDLPDETALTHALTHPAHEQWTGLQVRHDEPAQHLDLWLATTSTTLSFGRIAVGSAARAAGLVDPALRWAGAALHDGGTITYLAVRPVNDEVDELGVVAHGPDSGKVASHTSDLLRRWDQDRPAEATITACPAGMPAGQLPAGASIARPGTNLVVAW